MEILHPFEEIDPDTGNKYWLPFMVFPHRLNHSFRPIYIPFLVAAEFTFHVASIVAYLQAIILFSRGHFHINTKIVVNLGFITSIMYILHRVPLCLMEIGVISYSGPTDEWIVRITTWRFFFFDIMFFFQINILIERAAAVVLRRFYKNFVANSVVVVILILNISSAIYFSQCKVEGIVTASTYIFIVVGITIVCYMIFLVINGFSIKDAQKDLREASAPEKKKMRIFLDIKKRMNYVFGASTLTISIILLSLVIPSFFLDNSSTELIEITKIVFNLFCSFSFGFTVAIMIGFMKGSRLCIKKSNGIWSFIGGPFSILSSSYNSSDRAVREMENSWAVRRDT